MNTLQKLKALELRRDAGDLSKEAFEAERSKLLDDVPEAEEAVTVSESPVKEPPALPTISPLGLTGIALGVALFVAILAAVMGASTSMALTIGLGALGAITVALFRQLEDDPS